MSLCSQPSPLPYKLFTDLGLSPSFLMCLLISVTPDRSPLNSSGTTSRFPLGFSHHGTIAGRCRRNQFGTWSLCTCHCSCSWRTPYMTAALSCAIHPDLALPHAAMSRVTGALPPQRSRPIEIHEKKTFQRCEVVVSMWMVTFHLSGCALSALLHSTDKLLVIEFITELYSYVGAHAS